MQKVILHISTSDTINQKRIFSQITNILNELPDSIIEVATHADATTMLFKEGQFIDQIESIHDQVTFLACENSLRSHNKGASDLSERVRIVPSTLAHIITRQSEGWVYIKIG